MACKDKKGYTPAKAAKLKRVCKDSGKYWYEKTCSCLDKKPNFPKFKGLSSEVESIGEGKITYK